MSYPAPSASKSLPNRIVLVAAACLSLAGPARAHLSPPAQPHDTHAWNRWETTLTSTLSHSATMAYQELLIRVVFTPASGTGAFSGYAYWDGVNALGKNVFKVRAMFPQPAGFTGTSAVTGSWTWVTTCSGGTPSCSGDSGLHNRSGSLIVHSSGGNHPLYRRGQLKTNVSGSTPSPNASLLLDDGTTFSGRATPPGQRRFEPIPLARLWTSARAA